MPPSNPIQLRVSREIREALDAYCAKHGVELSDVIRVSVLEYIGRLDLLPTMRGRGQPKKSEVN